MSRNKHYNKMMEELERVRKIWIMKEYEKLERINMIEYKGRPYFMASIVCRFLELDVNTLGLLNNEDVVTVTVLNGLPCYKPVMLISVKALCQLVMQSNTIAAMRLKERLVSMGHDITGISSSVWQDVFDGLKPLQAAVSSNTRVELSM